MKVIKKTSVGGEWAKVGEDIKDGDTITILNAGTTISGDYGDREVFSIKTRNGDKNLSFNQSSINNLVDAYGDETENWKDKKANVYVVKQKVGNELKKVVYLTGEGWIMLDDGKVVKGEKQEVESNENPY